MGIKYKKNKKWGSRYFHVALNLTQNGFSSVGFKVGPLSWNTRTKAFRFDGPGGIYWQQSKGKQSGNREQRRASGDTASRGRGRKRRGAVGALGEWSVTWVSRGARWTAVTAGQAVQGHVDTITAPGRLAAERRRIHGRAPVVVDMTTGTEERADRVDLPDPSYTHPGLDAAALAVWRDQLSRDRSRSVEHLSRYRPLSPWERLVMRLRGDDPTEWERKDAAIDVALALHRSQRALAAAGVPAVRPSPVPGLGVVTNEEEDTVANPVRTLTDLTDPQIDPHNYAEELPEHITAAAGAARERAEQHAEHAAGLRKEAEAVQAYAEYMERARVDASVLSELHEAAEALDTAATAAATIAEQYEACADALAAGGRTAQSIYGEHQPPRFDQAS
ncbi:hypothetical protein [Pseudonocardia sp. NPDC049635]|uniref:hypothetical protein n=1 Tax=Pseudonocardia sp. NPDC049635 TaxID=3155506 RepID=UPI0033E16086